MIHFDGPGDQTGGSKTAKLGYDDKKGKLKM